MTGCLWRSSGQASLTNGTSSVRVLRALPMRVLPEKRPAVERQSGECCQVHQIQLSARQGVHQHGDVERVRRPLACQDGKRSAPRHDETDTGRGLQGRTAVPGPVCRDTGPSPGRNERIPRAQGQHHQLPQPLLQRSDGDIQRQRHLRVGLCQRGPCRDLQQRNGEAAGPPSSGQDTGRGGPGRNNPADEAAEPKRD